MNGHRSWFAGSLRRINSKDNIIFLIVFMLSGGGNGMKFGNLDSTRPKRYSEQYTGALFEV